MCGIENSSRVENILEEEIPLNIQDEIKQIKELKSPKSPKLPKYFECDGDYKVFEITDYSDNS